MMQKLPLSHFTWMTKEETDHFDIDSVNIDGGIGYILECDLKYPKKLHEAHNNLPLAPEILEVRNKNLSPYAKNALLLTDNKKRCQTYFFLPHKEKLCCSRKKFETLQRSWIENN